MGLTIGKYLDLCHKEISHPSQVEALKYLKDRFVTQEDLVKYRIGVSPCEWDVCEDETYKERLLADFPKHKKLLTKKLVFPIMRWDGELSGFIMRTLGDYKFYKKFLFYPHVPFYNVYGFYENIEEIARTRTAFIVESIFDLIAIEPWVKNGIAMLGTSFVDSQMAFLKRYVDKLYLGFNNDFGTDHQAGNNATKYSIQKLKKFGIRSVHVRLPDGINDFSDFRQERSNLEDFFDNYF